MAFGARAASRSCGAVRHAFCRGLSLAATTWHRGAPARAPRTCTQAWVNAPRPNFTDARGTRTCLVDQVSLEASFTVASPRSARRTCLLVASRRALLSDASTSTAGASPGRQSVSAASPDTRGSVHAWMTAARLAFHGLYFGEGFSSDVRCDTRALAGMSPAGARAYNSAAVASATAMSASAAAAARSFGCQPQRPAVAAAGHPCRRARARAIRGPGPAPAGRVSPSTHRQETLPRTRAPRAHCAPHPAAGRSSHTARCHTPSL